MIHETKINVQLWVSCEKKKNYQSIIRDDYCKATKIYMRRMMETHYDIPKSVSPEVQQSMKTSNKAVSEQEGHMHSSNICY